MLMPKRVKRRKQFRGSMAGKALEEIRYNGEFGLVATEPCWIQIQPDRGSPCCYDPLYQTWW